MKKPDASDQSCQITLWRRMADQVAMTEAVAGFCKLASVNCSKVAYGLVYSPRLCSVIRVDGPTTAIASDAFELRLFTESHELRWLRMDGEKGQAVIVTEDEITALTDTLTQNQWEHTSTEVEALRDRRYLLWGKVHRHHEGRTVLSAARIGELELPMEIGETDDFIFLEATEYIQVGDDDGNMISIGERLRGFQSEKGAQSR